MKIKKILAATLAATMVMSTAMTVCAAESEQGGSGSSAVESEQGGSGSSAVESEQGGSGSSAVESEQGGSGSSEAESKPSGGSSSSSSSSESAKSYAEKAELTANADVKVGGVVVKTSVAGVYAAKSVQGCAVKTDLATVKANLGLKAGQTPKIVIYDTDAKKSDKAMACINAAAEALGGKVVAALNIDLGAVEKGKWIELKDGSVALAVGLPKDADTTKTYSVICVQPGGVVTILEDLDTDPKTVTFDVKAGLGTYALVAK